ncbi:tetraacyldisaccharide 4'-kinase [uncultured Methylibium sp.]|uniref:tetraacyldisaccharide 4'-kinase n=1 Tax=uncultured Methylibium sp. TaxID=381093 RepID=UPI0025EF1D39|nr:tetraacyldisaccharide 4'-kinase [uncultured Methylibium sp.]
MPARARLEALLTRAWLARGALACLLWPLSVVYGTVIGLRRLAYRSGWLRTERVGRPVVVIGNRIAGGAGKTPTVVALALHLQSRGWRPGVVSRGHGRSARQVQHVDAGAAALAVGDEPLLLRLRTGVPVVVGRDRIAAARSLLAAHPEVDVLLADDGLQHLRLARDIEVLVFDARGAGNGWLLPAGPLREPVDAPAAGRRIVLYNAAAPSTPLSGFTARRELAGAVELSAWWRGEAADAATWSSLRHRPVVACAGIAQPQRFFEQLRAHGLTISELALPDHEPYADLPWPTQAPDVVITEKDAVKLQPQRMARERPGTRVWVAPLDFGPEPGFFDALDEALATLTPRTAAPTTP